jgi:hypothetical protein
MVDTGEKQANCRFLYFQCEFEGVDASITLQQALYNALNRRENGKSLAKAWQSRQEELFRFSVEDAEYRFVNHLRGFSRPDSNSVFGDLCRYRSNGTVAALHDDDQSEELSVRLIKPGQRQQFINGLLYWRVSGNHLIVVQSRSIRVGQLREYFQWLLTDRTDVLPSDVVVRFTAAHRLLDRSAPISSLTVRAGLPSAAAKQHGEEAGSSAPDEAEDVDGYFARSRAWLASLFPDEGQLARIMNKLPDDERIGIDITLRLPSKRKMTQPVKIADVERAMDLLREEEVTVQTEAGPVKLKDLTQKPEWVCKVTTLGGHWHRDDLMKAFGTAWQRFVDMGYIQVKPAAKS